ncbi:MAG: NRDE family protein [Spongiibacteraceae bacterium]|nr:NRDE family protein [Spongiibacteraceae bacterium]
MCLILFAFQYHPEYPLIAVANRDEFYTRPTRAAHFWDDSPELFAGRDLEAGGTWMGITTTGRFSAVTNFREQPSAKTDEPLLSRGKLTTDYLNNTSSTQDYLTNVTLNKNRYAGFNLLIGNHRHLFYCSNRTNKVQPLSPGLYGLSNGYLNEAWPKVESGKIALQNMLQHSTAPIDLLSILSDTTQASDDTLPNTGIDTERERLLSSRFIRTEHYGTRASTVLMVNKHKQVTVWEKNFDFRGTQKEIVKVQFAIIATKQNKKRSLE